MAESLKWWIRRCYTCQARKSTRRTVRWPLISLPLPSRPEQMVPFDLLGPLTVTAKGNEYVFQVVDLFSRHAEAYAITKGEKHGRWCSTVDSRLDSKKGVPTYFSVRWPGIRVSGMPGGIQDVGVGEEMYEFLPRPPTNGMVEGLSIKLCQMLSYLIADDQNNSDEMLLHAIAAHNNNVSTGTRLAPNKVHIGRYTRLPMTILEGSGVKGQQSEKRDPLAYLELMGDGQVQTHRFFRKEDRLIKTKLKAAKKGIYAALNNRTKFVVRDWAWVYDDRKVEENKRIGQLMQLSQKVVCITR